MKSLLSTIQAFHANRLHKKKVLVGVSGGLDSMVLCELLRETNIPFALAHVNYGLRGKDSVQDENFLARYAKKHGLDLHVLQAVNEFKSGKSNLQERARNLRYNFFEEMCEEHGYTAIVLAHHANDQVENFLLSASKGKGISALAGMETFSQGRWRPLLHTTKQELLDWAKKKKINWREDVSNQTDDYQRNRIRNKVLPELEKINPQAVHAVLQSQQILRESLAISEFTLGPLIEKLKGTKNALPYWNLDEIRTFPFAKSLLYYALPKGLFNAAQLEEMLELTTSGTRVAALSGEVLWYDRGIIYLLPAQSDLVYQSYELTAKTKAVAHFKIDFPSSSKFKLEKRADWVQVDFNKLEFPLTLRLIKKGDRIQPLGMKGQKKVSDLLIQHKVPVFQKAHTWVLESAGELVAVVGICVSERFKIEAQTSKIFRMQPM